MLYFDILSYYLDLVDFIPFNILPINSPIKDGFVIISYPNIPKKTKRIITITT